MRVRMKVTFDYYNERRSIRFDLDEVSLWEILTCIEEQTNQVFLDKNEVTHNYAGGSKNG